MVNEPVTINVSPSEVYQNTDAKIIVLTEDKLEIALTKRDLMVTDKSSMLASISIFFSLLLVVLTVDKFKSVGVLSSEFIKAFISICLIISALSMIWYIYKYIKNAKKCSISDFIENIKINSKKTA